MREIPFAPAQGMFRWFHAENERLGINPLLMTVIARGRSPEAIPAMRERLLRRWEPRGVRPGAAAAPRNDYHAPRTCHGGARETQNDRRELLVLHA